MRKVSGILAFVLMLLSGCASTKGSSNVLRSVDKSTDLAQYHQLQLDIKVSNGVYIQDYERDRIRDYIKGKIRALDPNRFNNICSLCNPTSGLKMVVQISRYDKGDQIARLFMAGLGQIRINAEVRLIDIQSGEELAANHASKTFAWGGIYGASTDISDIEPAFAEAVVEILKQESKQPVAEQRESKPDKG